MKRLDGSVWIRAVVLTVMTFIGAPFLNAQCKRGDVLVGEDDKYWYCASPSDFHEAAAELVSILDRAARQVNPKKSLDLKTQHKNCSAFFRLVVKGTRGSNANEIADSIARDKSHWYEVSGNEEEVTQKVQALANQGVLVVGVRKAPDFGHIAIVSPLPPNIRLDNFCGHGPMVRDGNVHHSSDGKKKPSGWGAVRAGYAFGEYEDNAPTWYIWTPSVPPQYRR